MVGNGRPAASTSKAINVNKHNNSFINVPWYFHLQNFFTNNTSVQLHPNSRNKTNVIQVSNSNYIRLKRRAVDDDEDEDEDEEENSDEDDNLDFFEEENFENNNFEEREKNTPDVTEDSEESTDLDADHQFDNFAGNHSETEESLLTLFGEDASPNPSHILDTGSTEADSAVREPDVPNLSLHCQPNDFQCKSDGKCVPISSRCDGWNHCLDNSDEENCHQTAIKGKKCHN